MDGVLPKNSVQNELHDHLRLQTFAGLCPRSATYTLCMRPPCVLAPLGFRSHLAAPLIPKRVLARQEPGAPAAATAAGSRCVVSAGAPPTPTTPNPISVPGRTPLAFVG